MQFGQLKPGLVKLKLKHPAVTHGVVMQCLRGCPLKLQCLSSVDKVGLIEM